MTIVHARTQAEAREYMALAVPECDEVTIDWGDAYADGDRVVQKYVAGCAERGIRREFEVVTDPVPHDVPGRQFGYGSRPSTLIDAGQWYLISARYGAAARAVEDRFAPSAPDLASAEEAYEWYSRAHGALGEVLKFIPPDGDEVPATAFWTPLGRSAAEQYGREFTRPVLTEAVGQLERALRAYRDAYA